MADVIFVAIVVAFVAVCVVYVRGLDRMISGSDEPMDAAANDAAASDEVVG